jgi:UDP-N-acetylglucosamine 2-epimerase (non-hydrolysing)
MKMAPIASKLRSRPDLFSVRLVHTGQHYDEKMSGIFFDELSLPIPDVHLNVGSGSHAQQTASIMMRFEEVLLHEPPDFVMVAGDVNSTMACAIDAAKLRIPVGHVEAGLRSGDRSMPEEINRLITDAVSDVLYTPSFDATTNLLNEGAQADRIVFVGNVMIDSLRQTEPLADLSPVIDNLGLKSGRYALLTLHRPSNVDDATTLETLIEALRAMPPELPLVFPIHPRTRQMMVKAGVYAELASIPEIRLIDPVGYIDFLKLQKCAAVVLTDSGGVQEETTALGVPCLTVRENTERPITVDVGTNILVGLNRNRILEETNRILEGHAKRGAIPDGWDGHAADRIVASLTELRSR